MAAPDHDAGQVARAVSRDELRAFDRSAIERFGVPGVVLMENAGRGAAEVALRLWPRARRVAILCGHGNNAGDGFVIARHLELAGREVRMLLAVPPARLSGDAAVMFGIVSRSGIPCRELAPPGDDGLAEALDDAELVVDALLGTGGIGPPRGGVAAAIAALAARRARPRPPAVLALDLPSGLDADTGRAAGACVRADATVTFVARKLGFDAPGAASFTGAVHVVGIGAPRALLTELLRPGGDRPA